MFISTAVLCCQGMPSNYQVLTWTEKVACSLLVGKVEEVSMLDVMEDQPAPLFSLLSYR